MKDMICKVSKNDTQRNVIDTLWPVFGIPLILPPDSMIMLEVEAQQIACISAPGFETENKISNSGGKEDVRTASI